MGSHRSSAEDIIQSLRLGKAEAIEELYAHYRADFFRWAGWRFTANRQDFEDAWQEAVMAFYTQIQAGKLTALRYEARTWLFAVGYKRLLNQHRKTKRLLWKDRIDEILREDASFAAFQEKQRDAEKKEQLRSAMNTLSPQCREMLVQRYFLEKSIEEMQLDWEHTSANTTSATLSRCLSRLKTLLKSAQTAAV